MTPEEIQRTMDFILQSQADSAIRHQEFQAEIDSLKEITGDLVRVSRQTVDSVELLRRIAEIHSRRLDGLEGDSV